MAIFSIVLQVLLKCLRDPSSGVVFGVVSSFLPSVPAWRFHISRIVTRIAIGNFSDYIGWATNISAHAAESSYLTR